MQHPPTAFAACLWAFSIACAGEPPGDGGTNSRPLAESAPAASASVAPARPDELGEVVSQMSDSLWIVFHDRSGAHWFGSDGQGAYRVDGKTIVRYTTVDGLCNDHIRQILENGSGNLYINTCGGISEFDGRRFRTLVPVDGGPSADEWKIEPDDLWFTGRDVDNGPYRYDGQSLVRLHFPKIALEDEFNSRYPGVPYSPYCVYTIYRDRRGSLWFGTANFGVCRYDGRSFTWITEDELTELDAGPAPGVRGIVEDKEGKFWFSHLQHRYDVHAGESTAGAAPAPAYRKELGFAPGEDERASPAYFMSGLTDARGVSWLATYGEGVWSWDGKQLTHFPVAQGGQPVTLFSIHKDREGVLWLGTQAAGAWRFNGMSFERFRP